MTKHSRACAWCGERIPPDATVGRPRRYCRRSHRQRAYEARRLARERRIHPDEVLVLRSTWDTLTESLVDLRDAARVVARGRLEANGPDGTYVESVARLSNAIAELQELPEPAARW